MEKSCQVPRLSSGLDIHHFILGSEGKCALYGLNIENTGTIYDENVFLLDLLI